MNDILVVIILAFAYAPCQSQYELASRALEMIYK